MRWHPVWLRHLQLEEALQYRQHQARRLNRIQLWQAWRFLLITTMQAARRLKQILWIIFVI